MVLAQVVVLVIVLAFATTMLVGLILGRHTVAARVQQGIQGRRLAESAQHMVYACLQDSDFGASTCAPTAAQTACFPPSLEGHAVHVEFSGAPPQCGISIKVGD